MSLKLECIGFVIFCTRDKQFMAKGKYAHKKTENIAQARQFSRRSDATRVLKNNEYHYPNAAIVEVALKISAEEIFLKTLLA